MVMSAGLEPQERGTRLADPRLRREVEAVVKRRIRGDEAEDVVQAALADVLSAKRVPDDAEEFRRFVFAVARNKAFDHFRRRTREVPEGDALEPAANEAPLSARDMLRWAEGKLPDPESADTLEWMLREGDGEKLEQIARDANLPAPRVRQRVSRLRRFLRESWAAEIMLGALGLALLVPVTRHYYLHWRAQHEVVERPVLRPEPLPTPQEQARELRRAALPRCEQTPFECLKGLDRARALDPQGDGSPEVMAARRGAAARLAPPFPPAPTPSSLSPSSTLQPAKAGPRRQHSTAPDSTGAVPTPRPLGSDSLGDSK